LLSHVTSIKSMGCACIEPTRLTRRALVISGFVEATRGLLYVGGFTNYVLPKGPDGFSHQTKAEFLSDNRLTLDVGKLLLEKPHTYDAFVGYRYWLNKYGNNDDVATNGNLQGMKEKTWYAGVAWHVF
jgi:hypothetical protein